MAKTISITNARKDIYKIANEVCECHEEMHVYNASTGNNVVIISEEDWSAIQETLYLNSIPGFSESVEKARLEPLEDCEVF
ncbi:MAG: type II toxin-antitoxin system Phd/YefM family antitoxin [Firmicutes bacterium]|nr:type II toxin-antitoxin system Phd/YefM family antitoxin [Bacillota bacterium]